MTSVVVCCLSRLRSRAISRGFDWAKCGQAFGLGSSAGITSVDCCGQPRRHSASHYGWTGRRAAFQCALLPSASFAKHSVSDALEFCSTEEGLAEELTRRCTASGGLVSGFGCPQRLVFAYQSGDWSSDRTLTRHAKFPGASWFFEPQRWRLHEIGQASRLEE
jgi:hypothetical protein